MLSIKVLGPGCAKCYAVERAATARLETVMDELPEIEATLVHIADPVQFMEYPILFTPGLVVNEKLVCAYDCGKAINPMLVEGQIDGGAAMGLSALMEELHPYYPTLEHYPTGFFSYMVPTA